MEIMSVSDAAKDVDPVIIGVTAKAAILALLIIVIAL